VQNLFKKSLKQEFDNNIADYKTLQKAISLKNSIDNKSKNAKMGSSVADELAALLVSEELQVFYPYEDISSFYIFTEGDQKRFKLLLHLKRIIHPFLSVSVASLKEEEIELLQNFLKGKLPEKKRHPTLSDFIGEVLGF
jgi:hypothetical protein